MSEESDPVGQKPDPVGQKPDTVRRIVSSNVAELLCDVAMAGPYRPALLRHDGRTLLTFAELIDRTARTATALATLGLRPGDRTALLVRDPPAALLLAVAVLWAGGTLVVPPRAGGWRLALAGAGRARPTVAIAEPATWLLAAAVPALARARVRIATGSRPWPGLAALDRTVRDGALDGAAFIGRPVDRPAEAPALVSWTSGTTGRPHAIVRTHGVLAAQHDAVRRLRQPRPDDVDLAGLPNIALHDLACGVGVVLPPRDGDPRARGLRDVVIRSGVTTAAGLPGLFERLADGATPASLQLLRSIHVGGGPVRPDLLERLTAATPNATIAVVYGSTEAEPIAAIDAAELRAATEEWTPGRGLPVGSVCDGIEVRLGATSSSARGRVLVRGARVARDPIRSDGDGWLDTGDVAAMDPDGRLWLMGRAVNVTRTGLFPAEIEEPAATLPGVAGAALVTVPAGGDELAVLAVEPSTAADATVRSRVEALAGSLEAGLDRIVLVRHLPRDRLSGKVDYVRLRALVGSPGHRRRSSPLAPG